MAIINGRGRVGIRRPSAAAAPSIILDGLKLYLDAGNATSYAGTGTVWTDLSGNGNNGTLTGGVTYASANGGSLVFNGTSYISRANFIGNITTFTVCHWINLSSNQTTRTIFSNYTGNGWVTGISDGATNVIKFYLGGGTLYATYPLVINTWYHVCVTYNNGNPSIYINGILNNTTTGTISFAGSLATNNDIGRLGDGRQYFNGNISNIQVYNRALSAAEVSQNYNALLSRFYPVVSDSNAQAFVVAAGLTSSVQANAVNALVTSMKSAGIWTKMKAVYPFVGGSAASHKWNLKDPRDLDAAFRLTFTIGMAHSANGIQGNAINTFANTYFIPSVQLTLTSGHYSIYSRTDILQSSIDLGVLSSNGSVHQILTRYVGDQVYSYASTNIGSTKTNGNSLGHYITNRNSSTNTTGYKNGMQTVNGVQTAGLPTDAVFIGGRNQGGSSIIPSSRQYSFATIGDGLTDAQAAALYTAVQAYQTSLGRQV